MTSNDRFGIPDSALRAALESHGKDNPCIRAGMYVPTREEVATMPAAEISEVLDLWMWESPTELIPSRTQIAEVRSILVARPDAQSPELEALIVACSEYLQP